MTSETEFADEWRQYQARQKERSVSTCDVMEEPRPPSTVEIDLAVIEGQLLALALKVTNKTVAEELRWIAEQVGDLVVSPGVCKDEDM